MIYRRGPTLARNEFVQESESDYVNVYATIARANDVLLSDALKETTKALHGFPPKVQDAIGKHFKSAFKNGNFFDSVHYLKSGIHDDAPDKDASEVLRAGRGFLMELEIFRRTRDEPVYYKSKDMPPPVAIGGAPSKGRGCGRPSAPSCQ